MSRLRHLKKFATLDNNQRIDALYQTIEEIVGGAAGEQPDITHHHDDRYVPRIDCERVDGLQDARISDLERDRAANIERHNALERRVANVEGGAVQSAPAPAPIPSIDGAVAAELAARIARVEAAAADLRNRPMPSPVVQAAPAQPDGRVDGLVDAVTGLTGELHVVRDELGALGQRMAGAEQRIAQPSMPANDDQEDLPAFLRGMSPAAPSIPIMSRLAPVADDYTDIWAKLAELERRLPVPGMAPEPPSAVQQLAVADIIARVDELERRMNATARSTPEVSRTPPAERIAATAREIIAVRGGPPLRVVEVAHLARASQDVPLRLMTHLGEAMGCGWEAAAMAIIRDHDAATQAAVEVYAIELAARRRIAAGEDAEAVAAASLAEMAAIGG